MGIEEALTEECFLSHGLSYNRCFKSKIVGQVMYTVLRLRCYMIPFLAAQATASIIVGDKFLVKNIILNILSIAFIADVDNRIFQFLLPESQIEKVAEFVHEMKTGIGDVKIASYIWIWSRVVSFATVTLMIFTILYAHNWPTCADSYTLSLTILFVTSVFLCLLHSYGVYKSIQDCGVLFLSLFRNSFALSYFMFIIYIFGIVEKEFLTMLITFAVITVVIGVCCFIVYSYTGLKKLRTEDIQD